MIDRFHPWKFFSISTSRGTTIFLFYSSFFSSPLLGLSLVNNVDKPVLQGETEVLNGFQNITVCQE